jgi:Ser/Thr protein kinase RdoA (MazF antagonist)
MPVSFDLSSIASQFVLDGDFVSGAPYGSGHINDTFKLVCRHDGAERHYLLQRINHLIFKDPEALMDNVERVTRHTRQRLVESNASEIRRRVLTLLPTTDGRVIYQDSDGNFWRCYDFIENATGYDIIESREQAFQAARAFGAFQALLTDLPGDRLNETIPDFHNTPSRYAAFEASLAADVQGRADDVGDEIAFAKAHHDLADALLSRHRDGLIPERVTHNDTKLNNVLLDDATNEAMCVIDLDTLMPGLALYDFGDLVRTSTSPVAEDEQDAGKVVMQMDMFRALVEGYLSEASAFLTDTEIACLPLAGQVITFEIGLRFLTDYLDGDTYFKTKYPEHNIHRCRTQFALVQSIADQLDEMNRTVQDALDNA